MINKICISLMIAGCAMPIVSYADMTEQQVKNVVHDYLIQNPEIVVQSLQTWQQKQMSEAITKTQQKSVQLANEIFHQASDPVTGNPEGKITVVEFFDYQCPHCIDMQPVFERLAKNNTDVRIIFKEFPIRGPVSETAARVALSAKEQGKYIEFHNALMQEANKTTLNEKIIYDVAKKIGLDIDKIKSTIKTDLIDKQLKATYQLAQKLQLIGTPAIFIANSSVSTQTPASAVVFVPGQIDSAQLDNEIKKISK